MTNQTNREEDLLESCAPAAGSESPPCISEDHSADALRDGWNHWRRLLEPCGESLDVDRLTQRVEFRLATRRRRKRRLVATGMAAALSLAGGLLWFSLGEFRAERDRGAIAKAVPAPVANGDVPKISDPLVDWDDGWESDFASVRDMAHRVQGDWMQPVESYEVTRQRLDRLEDRLAQSPL